LAAARRKVKIYAELELLTLKRKAAETKTEADYLESEHSRSTSKHSSIHLLHGRRITLSNSQKP
jgi:hypothetical protein